MYHPLLIWEDLFSHLLNQMVSYGIRLNMNHALDARPVESINSSVGSTSIVSLIEELDFVELINSLVGSTSTVSMVDELD